MLMFVRIFKLTFYFYLVRIMFEPEKNERILRNSLLFPLSKAFLEEHPQYYDSVNTYEAAIEQLPRMLEFDKSATIDKVIDVDDKHEFIFKTNIINTRLISPLDIEACNINGTNNVLSPNMCLATQKTYCLTLVGDVNYSYSIINKNENEKYIEHLIKTNKTINTTNHVIKNGLIVSVPLMLGSKWDTLRHMDISTLIRSGEECEGLYGMFIIKGYFRYLLASLKKPINKVIVIHNEYDEQLSRCEIQYSRGNDYENSYYIVGAMTKPYTATYVNGKRMFECNDYGFSLQFNKSNMNILTGASKKLINFIPIKILFASFGCVTDEEMLFYICPDLNDFALIQSIQYATLYGYKHLEAYTKAKITLENVAENYIKLGETLTPLLAKYIIGEIILSTKTLTDVYDKVKGNVSEYRLLISAIVDALFDECFMPAITKDKGVKYRNVSVCYSIGRIVRDMYYVGLNIHASQSKQDLTNKRVRMGLSVAKEFKSYWGVRMNTEFLTSIRQILTNINKSSVNFDEILESTIKTEFKKISTNQSASMIKAFCGNTEESKIRNEILEPKNQLFIWNKQREVSKSTTLQSKTVNESWTNRMPHPSEMFFLCPTETPDSKNVGKVRALAIHTKITTSTNIEDIRKTIKEYKEFKTTVEPSELYKYYIVNINDSIEGFIREFDDVENVYNDLMLKRSQNFIPCETSIVLNHRHGELNINCDNGRILAPFVIVKNCFDNVTPKNEFKEWLNKCNKDIDMFNVGIKQRFIEWMDCDMIIKNCVVADCIRRYYENPNKYTHVAINSQICGIISATNPCFNLNQGIRAGMTTNHLKQAMGVPACKYPMLKFMKLMDILISPHQPITQPAVYRYLHLDNFSVGQNVTICFIQYKYNQDDSIIFNQESVNNGLLKCETFTTLFDKIETAEDNYEIPNTDKVQSFVGNIFSYNNINSNTAMPTDISMKFNKNDVLICKTRETSTGTADISFVNKMPDANDTYNPRPLRCVERHYLAERQKNSKAIVLGQYRVIIPGDKVNSENCQKATVGRIVSPENLPYTCNGKRADIYFNPLSVFKRKTYGQLYISTFMKLAALYGCVIESSSFGTIRTPEEIDKLFDNIGKDNRGFETMYDAETGEKIGDGLFFGICYYERQHHMVESKINVRCKGGHDLNTGMPLQGKTRDGGVSFDRLSFNALMSASAYNINKDFHYEQCSKMEVGFCGLCHDTMCFKNNGEWYCPRCGFHDNIEIRYVSKSYPLFEHILRGLHLGLEYAFNV